MLRTPPVCPSRSNKITPPRPWSRIACMIQELERTTWPRKPTTSRLAILRRSSASLVGVRVGLGVGAGAGAVLGPPVTVGNPDGVGADCGVDDPHAAMPAIAVRPAPASTPRRVSLSFTSPTLAFRRRLRAAMTLAARSGPRWSGGSWSVHVGVGDDAILHRVRALEGLRRPVALLGVEGHRYHIAVGTRDRHGVLNGVGEPGDEV